MNQKKERDFLLQTTKQMNCGAICSGLGFLLYLIAAALNRRGFADAIAIIFGLTALYVYASIAAGRKRDKEAVSYNLLWGQTALTVLLTACAILGIRQRLGF